MHERKPMDGCTNRCRNPRHANIVGVSDVPMLKLTSAQVSSMYNDLNIEIRG